MRVRSHAWTPLAASACALALGCATPKQPPTEPTEPTPAAASTPALTPVLGDLDVEVAQDPALAYRLFTAEIGQWWDHHFVDKPYLLRLDARPGGAFVEFFDAEGNGAEHARVIYAQEGEALRMVGPLGLSGKGVEFVQSLTFTAREGGGTKVALHLEVIGDLDEATRALVLEVWEHFLAAYRDHAKSRVTAAAAAPRFAQPPIADASRVGLGFFSHQIRGVDRNHVHADDFAIDADATLVGVRFWGHSDGRTGSEVSNFPEFSLRIHSATPERTPGPIIYEQTIDSVTAKPTPTGRRAKGKGNKPGPVELLYDAPLAVPFALAGGATYFLSIAAVRRDPQGDAWMWSDGELRNGRSYSHALGDPRWIAIDDTDSAFELLLKE
ncbi:MAG: hypothetical protein R3B09_05255 [Nannocystaceae bacterium]